MVALIEKRHKGYGPRSAGDGIPPDTARSNRVKSGGWSDGSHSRTALKTDRYRSQRVTEENRPCASMLRLGFGKSLIGSLPRLRGTHPSERRRKPSGVIVSDADVDKRIRVWTDKPRAVVSQRPRGLRPRPASHCLNPCAGLMPVAGFPLAGRPLFHQGSNLSGTSPVCDRHLLSRSLLSDESLTHTGLLSFMCDGNISVAENMMHVGLRVLYFARENLAAPDLRPGASREISAARILARVCVARRLFTAPQPKESGNAHCAPCAPVSVFSFTTFWLQESNHAAKRRS